MQITFLLLILDVVCGFLKPEVSDPKVKAACKNELFCSNDTYSDEGVLSTIQHAELYAYSKRFVDMAQLNAPYITLAKFKDMMTLTKKKPTRKDLESFVESSFVADEELDKWEPSDINVSPKFLKRIGDPTLNNFARILMGYWPALGRKVNDAVKQYPKQHTMLAIPEPFLLHKSNAKELYYWQSYWIVKGLLLSDMKDTAKSIIANFAHFMKQDGYIPLSSRIYCFARTHPPLLGAMMKVYMEHTNDLKWLRANVDALESELAWWKKYRVVDTKVDNATYSVYLYGCTNNAPRLENYLEDKVLCNNTDQNIQYECYRGMRGISETGWEYSSRFWFDKEGGTAGSRNGTNVRRVLPVDGNAFMCSSYKALSEIYGKLGNVAKKQQFFSEAYKLAEIIEAVFYNKDDGIWYDYDNVLFKHRKEFFPSNFAPLWAECYDPKLKDEYGRKAAQYFVNRDINKYLGGVPSSLLKTGEEWDFPNVWGPMQDIVATGLLKTGNKHAMHIAKKIAYRFLTACLKSFAQGEGVYEKYHATQPGMSGVAGSDPVDTVYGSSIGVALSFIDEYASSARRWIAIINQFSYVAIFSLSIIAKELLLY